jgi:hypothetical protein
LRAAFKRAGLDVNNENHQTEMLHYLAWAIYGKKLGQPTLWTKKKLRQLLADVEELKAHNSRLLPYPSGQTK